MVKAHFVEQTVFLDSSENLCLTLYPTILWFNSLPSNKFLDWSKLKEFADNEINVTENLKIVLERVKNIVGNGVNAGYQHFLLFPQCLQKASFSGWLKFRIMWEIKYNSDHIQKSQDLPKFKTFQMK